MDRIDQMLNLLGEAIPEVIWERDAADVARPEDWGAAELRSAPEIQWADGRPIDTVWLIDLYLAVGDRESEWQSQVEDVLSAFDENVEFITWELKERSWQPQIQKALWIWGVRLYGPLEASDED